MKCANCGAEFESKFCPNCGLPAPERHICPSCGAEYTGNFCPDCGRKGEAPIEARCRNLYDKGGAYIDIDQLAGIYLSVPELKGYFKRNTNYTPEEAAEFAEYIDNYVEGVNYGFFAEVAQKSKFEAASRPAPMAKAEGCSNQTTSPQRPLSKRERIKDNKRNGVACCPKCGSTSLSANKKGFSFVKGAIGGGIGSVLPPVGVVMGLGAGNLGSKKVIITCMNCGHQWKP